MNARKYYLCVLNVCLMHALLPMVAYGQEAQEKTSMRDDSGRIEEIVSIGTKRSQSSATDLAVPVDVIGRDDLLSQGSLDTLDILSSIIPSYNVASEPIQDVATLIRPVSLRGLPSDSTLVLLNGKRRHRSSVIAELASNSLNKGTHSVDVASFPSIAFKQVEVLRDGASAQYGSDAIAGVINFQLEDDPTVRRVQVQLGSYYEGDGDNMSVSGVFGFPLGLDGFVTFAFEANEADSTSRGNQPVRATSLIDAGYFEASDLPDRVMIWGAPEVKDNYKGVFNVGLPVGQGILYSFGTHSTRAIDGSFFWRDINGRSGVFVDDDGILVGDLTPDGTGNCPRISSQPYITDGGTTRMATQPEIDAGNAAIFNLPDRDAIQALASNANCFSFHQRFPNGFTPRFGGTVTDQSIAFGFKSAQESGFNYDLSVVAGEHKSELEIHNTINASYGLATPTSFDLGVQTQSELLLNADFTLSVDVGAFSDLNVAFGAQYHDETWESEAGDDASWMLGEAASTTEGQTVNLAQQGFSIGANGFQGFRPADAGKFDRTSSSGYVDLEIDVSKKWLVNGAFRYEDFSDFGGTSNFKIASRYIFNDNLTLRGAISTGFRTPSVGQINLQRASTSFSGGMLVESLLISPDNPIAVSQGGGALDPEEAVNYSLGVVFGLGPISITADLYRIEVDNRIVVNRADLDDMERQALVAQGIEAAMTVSGVTFFVNGLDSTTTGLDITANYPFESALGFSDITLAFNWADVSASAQPRPFTPAELAMTKAQRAGIIRESLLSRSTITEIENGQPEYRLILSWRNTKGRFNSLVRLNYYAGTTEQLIDDESVDSLIDADPIALVDVELGFAFNAHYSIAVGAKNIFDERQNDHHLANTRGSWGADFPLNHPAGFSGGSYYLRLVAEF